MTVKELSEQKKKMLETALLPDEQVCWLGRSEKFPILTPDYKKTLIIQWAVLAVLLAAFIVGYLVWASFKAIAVNVVVIVVVVLLALYLFIFIPFKDRKTLMNESLYCVTDKRVLSFISDRSVIALNRKGLHVKTMDTGDSCAHVAFGSAADLKPFAYRSTTFLAPEDEETGVATGAVFYHVKDVKALTDLFS